MTDPTWLADQQQAAERDALSQHVRRAEAGDLNPTWLTEPPSWLGRLIERQTEAMASNPMPCPHVAAAAGAPMVAYALAVAPGALMCDACLPGFRQRIEDALGGGVYCDACDTALFLTGSGSVSWYPIGGGTMMLVDACPDCDRLAGG